MSELSSTAGVTALIAGGIGLLALLVAVLLALKLRRMRRDQRAVIGEGSPQDVVGYVRELERRIDALAFRIDDLDTQTHATARRLEGAITHAAVVRYDAYDEMSGRQSSSVALIDDRHNGVVLSSILQRDQARLYAKPVTEGKSDLGLSPEEREALDTALSNE